MNNRFIIIVPFYNVEKWIKYNIRSVRKQTYKNFKCILIDDMSTDNSCNVIKNEIKNDNRFTLIKNTKKKYALQNIVDAIQLANPSSEDIIVTLDGDDWLYSSDVLSYLNDSYNQEDCWLTYGSYVEYPSGAVGKFSKKVPQAVIENNAFRKSPWYSSHLRTFKFHLWDSIDKNDLLDTEGDFYKMAWDLSFMLPMLEMAATRSIYIPEIMYVYNLSNPLNDHKVDNSYQMRLEREIRNKNPYRLKKTIC